MSSAPAPDLNELAWFATVAEEGSFAAASRVLGVPKSTLSRRLSALESRLGVRLMNRSTRRFSLTGIGEGVLQHARTMRAEAFAAEALAAGVASEPRGVVRVSCPPALLRHSVGPMLARFLNAWPKVELQVQATNRRVDVWEDRIDLALRVRSPKAVLPADEVVRPLATSPNLLVAAPQLLTNVAPPSHPAELARFPTVGLGNSAEDRHWLLQHAERDAVSIEHRPRLVVDDASELAAAAIAGVGIAVLPSMIAYDPLAQHALLVVLPGWHTEAGQVQAAYASRRGMRPAVRQLLDALADGFGELIRDGRCLQATSPASPSMKRNPSRPKEHT